MKRRNFIKTAGVAASVPMLVNGMSVSALAKPLLFDTFNLESDRVLVLIQLSGGNDGLNTVIPLDQYRNLFSVRPKIIIPEAKTLKIDHNIGLHPSLAGMKSLYDEGKLSIVQSVGYPNQNRSHFRSMEIWSTASPAEEVWTTGWLGRYFDQQYPGYPENYPNAQHPDPFALAIGYSVSETCQGIAANFSVAINDPVTMKPLPVGEDAGQYVSHFKEELAFVKLMVGQTNDYSDRILSAVDHGTNLGVYPNTALAKALKNVAMLISGGLKTKVYVVSLGGFDTHSTQVLSNDPTKGKHADLLKTLSDAISAFQTDLKKLNLEKRVIGMTFSEFGRQIRANGSLGTDHGTAAPLFLFGSCVNAQVLGENPEIGTEVRPQAGVPMQHDFRDVYASVLMDWFDLPEASVSKVIHSDFKYLPIVSKCESRTPVRNPRVIKGSSRVFNLFNFPNPFKDTTTISFTCAMERVRLSVIDMNGKEIALLKDEEMYEGTYQVTFDARHLPPGTYFYQLITDSGQETQTMIKVN
ncbi:MAG: DUF1501 domain-containing protein [Saprospiraceae bacterium]